MKIKKIVLSLGMLLFVGGTLFAQALDESRVKFLPTKDNGIIKLHYAMDLTGPLKVTFFTKDGIVGGDKIKGAHFPVGVSKRYNVTSINDQDFWVVISSSAGTLTYRIVTSQDKQTFTSYFEDITPKPVLAEASK